MVAGALGLIHHKAMHQAPMHREINPDIVGHGSHRYRVDKKWGEQDPHKIPVNDCHEMVQDRKGRLILLTNHIRNNVIVYDRSGKVIKTWTGNWPSAHGLTIQDEGGEEFLYITDSDLHQVHKTTLDGRIVLSLSYPEESGVYEDISAYKPTETAIAPNGDIYVADGYGKSYIIQYDQHGNFIRHFGGLGEGDAQFDCPHGIAIDYRQSAPTLLITSRSRQEFKRFTLDGKHIETIRLPGCWICRPVIKNSHLYFAVIVTRSWWAYDGMVAVLDKENKVISLPGGSTPTFKDHILESPQYDGRTFLNPHDVCVDDDENIYVAQWYSGRTYPVKLERIE